jgi:hypothetical protein
MNNKFRHTVEFKQLQIPKPKDLDSALKAISSLTDELSRTHDKLQDSFTRLQNSVGGTSSTTINISSTNTSTGGISVASDLRANTIAVIAGNNTIVFSTPMTKDYVIVPIYISSMIEFIDTTQIVYTMNGFTVNVPNDGFLVYVVIPKT